MQVRNDYNECITNLACSMRRYFGLEYHHATLPYIDKLLDEYQFNNVVVLLCDGMGTNMVDYALNKADMPNGFLIRHRKASITTVFPSTTVAATTSMLTGLNPCETGMLGWYMRYPELNRIAGVFNNYIAGDDLKLARLSLEYYKLKYMNCPEIINEINTANTFQGVFISPFGGVPYETIDEMFEKILETCNKPGKKYVYAYYVEPDHTSHEKGCKSQEVIDIVVDLNNRIEQLAHELKDTLLIVTADHGHTNVENVCIDAYPDLKDCIIGDLFLDPRAVGIRVKHGRDAEFVKLFNKYFGDDFILVDKREVIESKLFDDGEENPKFRDFLGDYLAIGIGQKMLLNSFADELVSHHSGWTDDEIFVPVVVYFDNRKLV